MAVYTVLDREEIENFIKPFGVGPLLDYEGVAAGIENSNYFLSCDQSDLPSELQTEAIRHFVLTVLESIDAEQLAFFVDLTTGLSLAGLPIPCPLKDVDGNAIQVLQGKPALLLPKLTGEHPQHPNQQQCLAIGTALADAHQYCLQSSLSYDGQRGLEWLQASIITLQPTLTSDELPLLQQVNHSIEKLAHHPSLPTAVIHGDLFRDNALFNGNEISGIIDFYSAGDGYLMLDLAILVNDWCCYEDGSFEPERLEAVLSGYQHTRTLSVDEKKLWPDFLAIAAARFWVSRLLTQLQPESSHRPGGLLEQKDPLEYKNKLQHRLQAPLNSLYNRAHQHKR